MIIYRAVNKTNGKIYIGKTVTSLKKRISDHLFSKVGYFPNALRKYGTEGFDFSIVETCESEKILNERESYWIDFFGCKYPGGYNLTSGGEGMSGFVPSEATKKKLSDALIGRKKSDCTRKKISISRSGIVFSIEHRKNISEANRKRTHSEETKAKMSATRTGISMSIKARENISKSAKARVLKFSMPYMRGKGKNQLLKMATIEGGSQNEKLCTANGCCL